jgi:hypothetical protein
MNAQDPTLRTVTETRLSRASAEAYVLVSAVVRRGISYEGSNYKFKWMRKWKVRPGACGRREVPLYQKSEQFEISASPGQ